MLCLSFPQVTLLLFNAVANEAMPVFLEKIVPPYMAVLLSVSLVLIFGEIIPSALFTGKNQIILAAKLSSFVWFLLYVLYPITFPISKVLDCIFGSEEEKPFSRNELEALVILQNAACREEYKQVESSSNENSELSRDEIGIMTGVLRVSSQTALDAMIPINKVSMISSNVVLDESALEKIMSVGYSRYPVFDEENRCFVLGYLLVKKLIIVNPSEKRTVSSLELFEPIVVHPDEDLLEMLNIFQEGRSHLALVSHDPETTLRCIQKKIVPVSEQSKVIGIITLENIIEKIIQEEIFDESDHIRPLRIRHNSTCDGKLLFTEDFKEINRRKFMARRSLSYTGGESSIADMGSSEMAPLLVRPLSSSSERGDTSGYTTATAAATPSAPPVDTRLERVYRRERKRKPSLSVRPIIHPKNATNLSELSPPRILRYSTFDSLCSLKSKPYSITSIVSRDITSRSTKGP